MSDISVAFSIRNIRNHSSLNTAFALSLISNIVIVVDKTTSYNSLQALTESNISISVEDLH